MVSDRPEQTTVVTVGVGMAAESPDDIIGKIIGQQGMLVLVELDDGVQLLCRGIRQLHHRFDF